MATVNNKYSLVYDNQKCILGVFIADNNSVLASRNHNLYGSNNYQDFIDFIYDNNLYEGDDSKIDFERLEKRQENITNTLFKYDD